MIRRSRLRRADAEARCREVGRVLQGYLDHEVEPGFAKRIQEHLDDCRRCGLEAEAYRRLKTSLEIHQQPVDPEAVDRLRAFGRSIAESGGASEAAGATD